MKKFCNYKISCTFVKYSIALVRNFFMVGIINTDKEKRADSIEGCREEQISILMAVYNGMKFLPEQLSSLKAQTYTDWVLYIQDDLSTDGTVEYLQAEAAKDVRIKLLPNAGKLGAMKNFMTLLARVEAKYYMFCDQDDVWLPTKIEKSLACIKRAETEYGTGVPLVAHTDLSVVDVNLQMMAPSFWEMSRINPMLLTSFDEQAGHNLVTGCTMMFNRAARNVSLNFSAKTLMHDVWVLLCSLKHGGKVVELAEPTILYRQHGNNTLGAHDLRSNYFMKRLMSLKSVFKENVANYRMLKSAGYGNIFKYIYYKLKYYVLYKKG